MPKKLNLAGVRSGRVVAVEPTGESRRGSLLWRCRCDCGREFDAEGYRIAGGQIKSCGCARRGRPANDLTGRRFGKLTALYRLEEKSGASYLWQCQCDCGRQAKVSAKALASGSTQSCGCARTAALQSRALDLSGRRFGRLVALEPTEKREWNSVVWRCQCDCGRMVEVAGSSLTSGNTKSCGCLIQENKGPAEQMHYIDGTCVELLQRKNLRKDNTSGCTGVVPYRGRWRAQITFKKKTYYLGVYDKLEDAIRIRKKAEERVFGEFLEWYEQQMAEAEAAARKAAV